MSLYPGDPSPYGDLIGGYGSDADFLAEYGDYYIENQSLYDVADNGSVQSANGVTEVKSPNWFSSLTGVLNQGVELAGTVGSAIGIFTDKPGRTSAAQQTAANTQPGAVPVSGKSFLPWILGGIAVVVGLVVVLMVRK